MDTMSIRLCYQTKAHQFLGQKIIENCLENISTFWDSLPVRLFAISATWLVICRKKYKKIDTTKGQSPVSVSQVSSIVIDYDISNFSSFTSHLVLERSCLSYSLSLTLLITFHLISQAKLERREFSMKLKILVTYHVGQFDILWFKKLFELLSSNGLSWLHLRVYCLRMVSANLYTASLSSFSEFSKISIIHEGRVLFDEGNWHGLAWYASWCFYLVNPPLASMMASIGDSKRWHWPEWDDKKCYSIMRALIEFGCSDCIRIFRIRFTFS